MMTGKRFFFLSRAINGEYMDLSYGSDQIEQENVTLENDELRVTWTGRLCGREVPRPRPL